MFEAAAPHTILQECYIRATCSILPTAGLHPSLCMREHGHVACALCRHVHGCVQRFSTVHHGPLPAHLFQENPLCMGAVALADCPQFHLAFTRQARAAHPRLSFREILLPYLLPIQRWGRVHQGASLRDETPSEEDSKFCTLTAREARFARRTQQHR